MRAGSVVGFRAGDLGRESRRACGRALVELEGGRSGRSLFLLDMDTKKRSKGGCTEK